MRAVPTVDFDRYTALDVETPNRYSRSFCSIGLVCREGGVETLRLHMLIDPEDDFDAGNIWIHGIRPEDVEGAPTLETAWEQIEPLLTGRLVLAHNALFDLPVIKRALERRDLETPKLCYICTLQKARRHIPKYAFGGHSLAALTSGLGIPLENHHNALDDALACADLYDYLRERYGCSEADVRRFF